MTRRSDLRRPDLRGQAPITLRFCLAAIAFGILAGLGGFTVGWLAVRWQVVQADSVMSADVAKLPSFEVGLVLGTGPFTVRRSTGAVVPNIPFVYRLEAAAALWRAGKVKYLLVSGNRTGSYDEPTLMRAGLIERGVPAEAIYRDYAGYRTNDSMLRAQSVFGLKRLVVVSQSWHVVRAIYLARSRGLEAWGFEAKDEAKPRYRITDDLGLMAATVLSYWEVWWGTRAREQGPPIAIGVDPPN